MPTVEVRVQITVDGRPIPGFDPYLRRMELPEITHLDFYTPGDTPASFIDVIGSGQQGASVRMFAATHAYETDSDLLWRRGKDTTSIGIPIKNGGLILLVDCGIGSVLGDGESPFEYKDAELSNFVRLIQGGS